MKWMMLGFAVFFSMNSFALSLNKIIVFGDSISDNGHFYEVMSGVYPPSPPYYYGRFSNGPIWIDLLMEYLYPNHAADHLLNYAYGGAVVNTNPDHDDSLFYLDNQINQYLSLHDQEDFSSNLYVLWAGSNNYMEFPESGNEEVKLVVDSLINQYIRLIERGAKYLMVVNQVDLGKTPVAVVFNAENYLSDLSLKHNLYFKKSLDELKTAYPDVVWVDLDVAQMVDDILKTPANYGITYLTETCFDAIYEGSSVPSGISQKMASTELYPLKPMLYPCDGYLFFDPIHPAHAVHQEIFHRVQILLDKENIYFE